MGEHVGIPYARGSDTSQAAAESMVGSAATVRLQVLQHVISCGFKGATCDEIEAALGMTHQTASARINELRNKGMIEDSERRRDTRSGRKAAVWIHPASKPPAPRSGMDAQLDGEKQKKKARKGRGPVDRATLDIFTGEPAPAPEKKERALNNNTRLLLETILAKGVADEASLRGSPPHGVSSSAVTGLLTELKNRDMIVYRIPRGGYNGKLEIVPTTAAWSYIRRVNEAEGRPPVPPEKPLDTRMDPETRNLLEER